VDECKAPALALQGLHSSTSQIAVSHFCVLRWVLVIGEKNCLRSGEKWTSVRPRRWACIRLLFGST